MMVTKVLAKDKGKTARDRPVMAEPFKNNDHPPRPSNCLFGMGFSAMVHRCKRPFYWLVQEIRQKNLYLIAKAEIKDKGFNPEGLSFCVYWSRHADLNRRPADYESAALPLSYAGSDDELFFITLRCKWSRSKKCGMICIILYSATNCVF